MSGGFLDSLLTGRLQIPAELQTEVTTALRLIDATAGSAAVPHLSSSSIESLFVADSSMDGEGVLAILGPRGSGKTTLLIAICRKLIDDGRHIVLPVIRPELFEPDGSILVAAIAAIWALVEEENRLNGDSHDAEARQQMSLLVQRAARAAATTSASVHSAVAGGSDSLGQHIVDVNTVDRERATLNRTMREMFASLGPYLDRPSPVALVIPIDDADLVPGRVSRVLADIRMLGSFEALVPIVCADRRDLAASLEADLAKIYIFPRDEPRRREQTSLQLAKTLPPNRVIEPRLIDRNRRLTFVPFGETRTLREVLEELNRILNPGRQQSGLFDWLQMSDEKPDDFPSHSLDWLPSTPRALEHIWQVANDAVSGSSGISVAIRRLLNEVEKITPLLNIELQTASGGAESLHSYEGIIADARWPSISAGIAAEPTWHPITESGRSRVKVRRAVHSTMSLRQTVDQADERGDDAKRIRFDREGIGCALFAQAILGSGVFAKPRPVGPFYMGWSDHAFLQVVRIAGLETDDNFFFLPIASSPAAIARTFRAWNSAVQGHPELRRRAGDCDDFLTRLVTVAHDCCMVGAEDVFTDPPQHGASALEDLDRALTRASRAYLRHQDGYRGITLESFGPRDAFCQWYEVGLPHAMHSALLSDGALSLVVEVWQATISAGQRSQAALLDLREHLDRRFAALGLDGSAPSKRSSTGRSPAWICGYRDLLENAYSESLPMVMKYAKEYDERIGGGSFGRSAIDENVLFTHESSSYMYAAHRTAESQDDFEAIMSALESLRS